MQGRLQLTISNTTVQSMESEGNVSKIVLGKKLASTGLGFIKSYLSISSNSFILFLSISYLLILLQNYVR